MLLAIVAMWTTTLAYWVANIVAVVEAHAVLRDLTTHLSNRMLGMQDCLAALPAAASSAFSSCMPGSPLSVRSGPTAYGLQTCTGTAALTINAGLICTLPLAASRANWVLFSAAALCRSPSETRSYGGARGCFGQTTESSAARAC